MRCENSSRDFWGKFYSQIKVRIERRKSSAPYSQPFIGAEMSGATNHIALTEEIAMKTKSRPKDPKRERQKEHGSLITSLSCHTQTLDYLASEVEF